MNKARRIFFFLTMFLTLSAGGTVGMMIFSSETPKETEAPVPLPESLTGFSAESEEQQKSNTEKPQEIINPEGKTLQERVAPPPGYERTEEKGDSLTTFLREYPLKKAGKPVLLYNGDETGQKERISFRFVDGFQAEYSKWRSGYRIQAGESRSSWVPGGARDDSYENFKKYLRMVFAYAGTLSMEQESKKIKLSEVATGDIFLYAGSPGHVVMVVDVCRSFDGKKAFLLGQGFMPAQEFHLLKNPLHEDNPWYYLEEVSYPLQTPEYSFKKGSFRRLEYLLH